ncbi:MAG: hypothetical protein JWO69_1643 [Thermoleophilia bacterium]|jgi:hypothetical protein|nr:hypothetical protein [Thermoleophilia bacterium]
MAKDIRVDLGFVGGGGTALEIPEAQIEGFRSALKDTDNPWFTVTSSDGAETYVDLSKIVYVRVASTSRSIGFSHA